MVRQSAGSGLENSWHESPALQRQTDGRQRHDEPGDGNRDQGHLVDGHFDVDKMIRGLEEAVQQALNDRYLGLWATGDMTWEFGSRKETAKLLE
jgi:MEDS: MEthanogen/methylotroph, DcmR Sensory domain